MEQSSQLKDTTTNNPLLSFLHSLKKSSKNLKHSSIFITHNPQLAIEALLNLQIEHLTIFSNNPKLSKINQLSHSLKTLLETHKKTNGYCLNSIVRRRVINYRIYRVACAIQTEVQTRVDQEIVLNFVKITQDQEMASQEEKLSVLKEFQSRLLLGFDSDFQELVLKAKGFSILEFLLCDTTRSKRIREESAICVVNLVKFNRDVFVGLVLMGPIIQSLISMASVCSIQVLTSLIRLIKTPLIDEIELDGEIPRIISLLRSEIKGSAMDCVCEIAYLGRKEVVEGMIGEGLVEKLMELQRLKDGGEFCNCVKRFAVNVEVGEGLDHGEKQELKLEILKRVGEASVSEAECASVFIEVLWGPNCN